ncbi:methyltransferase domain-containing protein [Candidatus Enterovibrio altilux]|uniref:SAM-dependent methyltransferase n=1 Tax=Candidatus Enterovibrio altilux TaxID=1927128 RepID=A0A291B7B6_9GAMM|nr:methyltransferase domain-containing protein [Candidatus Enterovibrio luxaltus]ATF08895.1 SAM-dependent methyltransferase [Candidatus Enterovibrio luxaltus]
MKPARSKRPLEYPYTWDQFSHGEWACSHIQTRLDEWLPRMFGYHMLKLGGLSCELTSDHCNIRHQVCIDKLNPLRTIESESYSLPFINKAFDVCVLANQLDYIDDPHRLLREIDRVTIDDGYIIVSGVNPRSIMGVGRLIPWRKNKLPWNGRMFTSMRVRDWLGVLNYEVLELSCFGLVPVTKYRTWSVWFENSCSGLLPAIGSLYFIVARKRIYSLKLMKPEWRLRKQLSPVSGFVS